MNKIITPLFGTRFRIAIISLLAFGLMASVSSRAAPVTKRGITEKDLFDFIWIGDPQLSPDGSRVAYVRVTVNEKKEGYKTSIWTVATAGSDQPHQLTNGERDGSPRWSPDGKYLVFTRATEKDGKPEPAQLFMLSMAGGDSFAFTDLPKGAGEPAWSPDGKLIAFTSTTNAEDLAKQEKKKRKEEEAKKAAAAATSPTPGKKNKKRRTLPRKSQKTRANGKAIFTSSRARFTDRTTTAISISSGLSISG